MLDLKKNTHKYLAVQKKLQIELTYKYKFIIVDEIKECVLDDKGYPYSSVESYQETEEVS